MAQLPLNFFVPGIPAPGGSKRAFIPHRKGETPAQAIARGAHPNIVDMSGKRGKEWRAVVALAGALEMDKNGFFPYEGALRLDITFRVLRPASHFGKNGLLPSAPRFPCVKPDLTKLVRSTEDALKGITWKDDTQVIAGEYWKLYGDTPGALISISILSEKVCPKPLLEPSLL